jgi:hypothetical protein
MARKPVTETNSPDVEPTDAELLDAEETGTEESDEVVADSTAATAADTTPVEADLTDFNEAVASVVWPNGNENDGQITESEASNEAVEGAPDDAGKQAVLEAYNALEGAAAKRLARTALETITSSNMDSDNFYTAKKAMLLKEHILNAKAVKAPKVEKVAANPTGAFIDHLVALNLAFQFASTQAPENVDADWQTQYTAALADATTRFQAVVASEDQVTDDAVFQSALKLGARKVTKSRSAGSSTPREGVYSGPPRSILKHIIEAFDGQPSGTFLKINEISKFESSEYGSDHPSPGAISGRINQATFGDQAPGLVAVVTPGEPKGVRKV